MSRNAYWIAIAAGIVAGPVFASQQGASQQGASQQGASQQGASQQGASQQGANQQGANQQGANQQGANQQGTLAGRLLDDQKQPIVSATIVVCDQQTGVPVGSDSWKPVTQTMAFQGLATAVSDREGNFSIKSAKPGRYRLIAQSWRDAETAVSQPLEVNGRVVVLHGVAEDVLVPSDAAKQVRFRSMGTAVLDVTASPKPGNDETLVVVSRAPLAADPILAFTAWSGPFMSKMLTANRMPRGRTTFHGLPEGTVYVAAFAADNSPGFGGARVALKAGQTLAVTVPLIASWSNGHKEPPADLVPLVARLSGWNNHGVTELIKEQHQDIADALQNVPSTQGPQWGRWGSFLHRKITFPDGQTVLLRDLVAADGYRRLAQHAEKRAARMKQKQLQQLGVDSSVTYVQAAKDLYERLGKDYPNFRLKEIDWNDVGQRLLPRAESLTSDDQFGLLCLEMVAALQDSHAQLQPAAAKLPHVPVARWDAGFACLEDDRSQPIVYFLVPGSSAALGGVKVGMTVKRINGVDAKQAILQTMDQISRYVGYSSRRYLRYHAFRFFARQMQRGDAIKLTVVDLDGKLQILNLRADRKPGYVQRLPVSIDGIAESRNVSWKMLDDNTGYVYVRRIRDNLIESLDQAIGELQSARNLIIDVRGNSGGGFDAKRSHRNFALQDPAEPNRPRFSGNIAVLIDSRCISAGEGWASWFVANKRARFFGTATAGASARKASYLLLNGLFKVRYPIKAYTGFLDRPIERRGLEPDVQVMPNVIDLAAGTDTVLEAARKYLAERETD